MIARSTLPFPFRDILNRVGLAKTPGHSRVARPTCWLRIVAELGDRLLLSTLTWRSDIMLHDRPERFHRFCHHCREDTPHEGFDEFGAGWYAQICRCPYCGDQGNEGLAARLVVIGATFVFMKTRTETPPKTALATDSIVVNDSARLFTSAVRRTSLGSKQRLRSLRVL